MARKLALIIGNSQYEDACLSRLAAPDVDVRALADVLKAPGIGAFDEVTPLLNEGLATVRKAIARFFDLKHRDDLLFLYFSGHGVRDEQGHLYLAVRDTERAVLAGTAIEASYVTARMDRSASKRLVLVLDCCHSGAFGYGSKAAQGAPVGTATAFEGTGRGRVVLTATDSTQYAWEGDQVLGDVENSLFTHYMIEGLQTGAADRDEDGLITIDELYDYVYEHVLNETPKQTPGKWAFGQQGEIVIAHNPGTRRANLPPEIEEAAGSKLPSVRLEAVRELENILKGRHAARAAAAHEVLKRLAEDDSRRVATAALEILKAFEQGVAPAQPETPVTQLEKDREKNQQEEELRRRHAERDAQAAQIAACITTAQTALDRGALDEARATIARASQLAPQHADVIRLQEMLRVRLEERTRLDEAERRIRELRQQIGMLIARANAAGSHDEAITLLNEAIGLDPEHAEVKERLGERRRLRAEAEAADRRARSIEVVKERITRHLERGELEEAERALSSSDPLGAPAEVFAPFRQRLAELHEQRRREAEDAARQQAEAEQRAREEQIERHLASARTAISQRRFADALDSLTQASGIDPRAHGLAELVRSAERGRAAAEAEARQRQEIQSQLAEASRHLTKGNLTKAIVLTDVILTIDPEHAAAKSLHADIQRAVEDQQEAERRAAQERERQRQLEDMLATAEAAATHDGAIEILNEVLSRDPGNSKAQRLLRRRQEALEAAQAEQRRRELASAQATIDGHLSRRELQRAAQELDAAESRFPSVPEFRRLREQLKSLRQEEEVKRRAEAAVAQAKEVFARGDHELAITDLSKFRPQQPNVSEALRALKAQVDEIRRAQREKEQADRIEAERAARQERIARLMAAARAAIDEQRFQDALDTTAELRGFAADTPGLEQLTVNAQSGLEALHAAEVTRREIEQSLKAARKRLRRRDYAGALGLVDDALSRDSQHAAALALRAEVQRASEDAPARPAAFSLRPTLSAAGSWFRTKALYSNTFKITAGVALTVVIAVGIWRPASEPPSVTGPTQGQPQVTEPKPAPPPSARLPEHRPPTAPPTVDAPKEDAVVAASPVTRSDVVVKVEQQARQQLDAGNVEQALTSVQKGLSIDSSDAGLRAVLNEILKNAQARAVRASGAAEKTGAVASKELGAARKAQLEADRSRDAGSLERAIRGYWNAAKLYDEAAKVAAAPASAAANDAPPATINPAPTRSDPPPSSTPPVSSAGRGTEPVTTPKPAPSTSTPASRDSEKPATAPLVTRDSSRSRAAAHDTALAVRRSYESALEDRNVDALKSLWPSMPRQLEDGLRRSLGGYRSLKVELSDCSALSFDMEANPPTATMTCREEDRARFAVGGGGGDVSLVTKFVFTLSGASERSWVLASITRTPTGR
jgi:Caspase domain